MQKECSKKKTKGATQWENARIHRDTKKITTELLKKANNKKYGRTIKADQILRLGLTKIDDADIQFLQEQSLTPDDLREKMRLFYVKNHGPITMKEFTAFSTKLEYIDFLKSYHQATNVA